MEKGFAREHSDMTSVLFWHMQDSLAIWVTSIAEHLPVEIDLHVT